MKPMRRFSGSMLILVLLLAASTAQAQEDSLAIAPGDTTLQVGEQVEFTAVYFDSSETEVDTSITWSVSDTSIAEITTDGLLTATAGGETGVTASVGDLTASAAVIVEADTASDSTGVQTITVVRDKPGRGSGREQITVLQEGESYKLSGFPYPLNYLNGGRLTFPEGSLTEDVTLAIEVPGFAEVSGNSVSFPEDILSGVTFTVNPEDTTAEHYYFEEPVQLALVFKRGLLNNLGIEPAEIGMYYYDEESGYEDDGISNTVVDSSSNRIYADVAHFSNLVLAKENATTGVSDEAGELPVRVELSQNYPNPFNPATTFRYEIDQAADVRVAIYDALGRRLQTLVERRQAAGTYTVRFDASDLSSGLYFYRLRADDAVRTRQMMLAK